ncbi:hypothetical protein PspLS_09720 [Pyricularia sp. CBS 133598]|nr:hypothetical protein PspLS_09720 [Pyricularia sp. CBS 133598]
MASNDDGKPIVPEQSEFLEYYEHELDEMDEDEELFCQYMDCIPDNNLGIWYPRASDAFLHWANNHRRDGWHGSATRAEAQGFAAAEQDRHRHNIPADTRSSRVRQELVERAGEQGRRQQRFLHKPGQPSKLRQEILPDGLEDEGGSKDDGGASASAAAVAALEEKPSGGLKKE